MYEHSTAYYDLIYRGLKDYQDEALKIHTLLQKLPSVPKRLLDVGCGTGEHARILANRYDYEVDGIDIQPGFIECASPKLPSSRFAVADMRDFDLGCKYDAILCLFSSIGYVETIEGLERAFANIANHLEDDGWLLCEPWVTPDLWTAGQSDVVTANNPDTGETITRTRHGKTDRNVSVMDIEYVIEGRGESRSFSETHRLAMFEQAEIEAALDKAGLNAIWLPSGLQSQTLLMASRPIS